MNRRGTQQAPSTGSAGSPVADGEDRPFAAAYLVSAYPALSHAFIEREVLALREAGARVETFTVRAPDADALLSQTARAEAARTTALVGQPVSAYANALRDLLRDRPTALLHGLAAAWSDGPRSIKAKAWQHFYLVEAVLLLQRMRRLDLRHLHVHFANNGADVARLAVTLGRAVEGPDAGWRWTFSMHGPTEFDDPEGHDLAGKVRSASTIACISEYARERLRALVEPEHWAKMGIVRMGVTVERFPPAADLRSARAPGPLRVLFVGRLVPEKAPELLVRAAQALREAGRALDVVLIGAGPLREGLEREVHERHLENVVRLLGPIGQDELPTWYEWADVFCLPSYAEGVPVVLMEAMATELPVVTTRIAGVPELVIDGENGVLIEAGDLKTLTRALERLGDDPETRHRAGRAGRAKVLDEFQPGPNARKLLDLLHPTPAAQGVPALPADAPVASVVLRTFNSAETVRAAIRSVREQDVTAEIVVVDSGSTDRTLELVDGLVERVVHLEPGTFTYGRALNAGAAAASTAVLVPLSSHSVLPRSDWLRIAVEHVRGGATAVCGLSRDGEGEVLSGPFRADHAYVSSHRYWGLTNTASALSREAWRRHPFDETLVATEDLEWTWRALVDFGPLVADPRLLVSGEHRRAAGLREYHRRMVREMSALAHLRPLRPYGLVEAVLDVVRETPHDPLVTGVRRMGRTRVVDVISRWVAGRAVARAGHVVAPGARSASPAGGV